MMGSLRTGVLAQERSNGMIDEPMVGRRSATLGGKMRCYLHEHNCCSGSDSCTDNCLTEGSEIRRHVPSLGLKDDREQRKGRIQRRVRNEQVVNDGQWAQPILPTLYLLDVQKIRFL